MGVCLSCLRGRENHNRSDERQPLLEPADAEPSEPVSESNDQQHQRIVTEAVNSANNLLIDVSALSNGVSSDLASENTGTVSNSDLSELRAAILRRAEELDLHANTIAG